MLCLLDCMESHTLLLLNSLVSPLAEVGIDKNSPLGSGGSDRSWGSLFLDSTVGSSKVALLDWWERVMAMEWEESIGLENWRVCR